jgi:hypothetical protein
LYKKAEGRREGGIGEMGMGYFSVRGFGLGMGWDGMGPLPRRWMDTWHVHVFAEV